MGLAWRLRIRPRDRTYSLAPMLRASQLRTSTARSGICLVMSCRTTVTFTLPSGAGLQM